MGFSLSAIENNLYSYAVNAAKPEKIKVEWRYLPDWLFDFSRSTPSTSKFVSITRPRVYVKTKAGLTFGYDVATGKPLRVPPNAFTPGKFQTFLHSKDFQTFLTFSFIGLILRKLFK